VTGAGDGGGPHVRVLDGLTGQLAYEFFPFDQNLRCGARVACRDLDGDGAPEVICAPGPGVPAAVRIFSGRGGRLVNEFTAYEPWFQGGAFIACR
jgi:hypothetical protein